MQPTEVKTADDAKAIIRERGLKHIKVGVFDMDGIMRGKYMSCEKFFSALDSGFGFCDVILGWDCSDQLYDNVTYTGWHTGYGDSPVRIIVDSCREIPFEDGMLLFLGEFVERAEPICPRGLLRRVLQRASAMGFSATAACEFEFFVFDETPDSIRKKHFHDLKTITPGYFGYSMLRNSVYAEFYEELLETCDLMDFPIEGLHTETGPGVLEAAITYTEALAAADRAALFKTYAKILAQRQGWMATFMAKWSPDWPGQSGHIHLALQQLNGHAAFYDDSKPHNMSDTMRWFIGGQQVLLPELLCMIAPTINSFTRLVPGFWAPTAASWGVENRTCALRAIPGKARSQRVEYRISAADINPYIAIAAALGSGLWGIEQQIEPDAAIVGNAYDVKFAKKRQLPATLFAAAGRLRRSKAARAMFGDAFVEHYAATREWEEREFRKHITDWEMNRYFEII
ncbi:MAG TPA: glutamine synthetase [Gammaproteobacteria bacterium]|mgnify:CR=1 FL=1|nr:glutamine synthetase [Gammaproteobacteria bacterium]